MQADRVLALIVVSGLCVSADADMIVFENYAAAKGLDFFDPNYGNEIYGQSLDITHAADQQPMIGEMPAGSIFFMHLQDLNGDFIWIGTGTVTNTAESTDPTRIPIPIAPEGIDYFGPQAFHDGDAIDSSANFVDGWRPVHGYNDLTGLPGVFTVDDAFTVGIEFEQDGGMHYGFAQFDLSYEVREGVVDIDIIPTRWGYNDIAGQAATVVPAPGGVMLVGVFGGLLTRRRR
ncbi:MAG: hypothetical protein CMJ35_11255 [Phycisphaerae bacterium]|nr:hypothetical protein [Phycisphaerae bacterium]MBM92169.1 hypothetical protein [Phycisphaerae bacterium]